MIPGYRLMWLLVTFDLPVETKENKRDYRRFVDFLEDNGYSRIQYSIYVRPTTTHDATQVHAERIANNIPPAGEVRVFRMTDKQWARTECYHNGSTAPTEPPPEQFIFFDENFVPTVDDWKQDADAPGPDTFSNPPAIPVAMRIRERPDPAYGKRKSAKRIKPKQETLEL
jgi:CRISPR-associated protein Cas2